MGTPRKHAELIKAWADGAEIECQDPADLSWHNTQYPSWITYLKYRIKPKTIKYRVALFGKTTSESCSVAALNTKGTADNAESQSNFNRWLTDWIEVEV